MTRKSVFYLFQLVVIDKREDRNCSTGKFELAFRDQYVCQPRCVEPKMTLAGQRIRRLDLGVSNNQKSYTSTQFIAPSIDCLQRQRIFFYVVLSSTK